MFRIEQPGGTGHSFARIILVEKKPESTSLLVMFNLQVRDCFFSPVRQ
jgi:hypothetical protein